MSQNLDPSVARLLQQQREKEAQQEYSRQAKEERAKQLVADNQSASQLMDKGFSEMCSLAQDWVGQLNGENRNTRYSANFSETNGTISNGMNNCSVQKVFFAGNGKDPGFRLILPGGTLKELRPNVNKDDDWSATGSTLRGKRENSHSIRDILEYMFYIVDNPGGEQFVR